MSNPFLVSTVRERGRGSEQEDGAWEPEEERGERSRHVVGCVGRSADTLTLTLLHNRLVVLLNASLRNSWQVCWTRRPRLDPQTSHKPPSEGCSGCCCCWWCLTAYHPSEGGLCDVWGSKQGRRVQHTCLEFLKEACRTTRRLAGHLRGHMSVGILVGICISSFGTWGKSPPHMAHPRVVMDLHPFPPPGSHPGLTFTGAWGVC